MSGFAPILLAVLAVAVAVASALFFVALVRGRSRSGASQAVSRGQFREALRAASHSRDAQDLLSAALAARHLGDFAASLGHAHELLAVDPTSGEAWLELALGYAYTGAFSDALEALDRASELMPALGEAITLHRAWIALRTGDVARAGRLFEEIEASLETKLRTDLGPGDPVFAEWFFQTADLWRSRRDIDKARWAARQARRSAPQSTLGSAIFADQETL